MSACKLTYFSFKGLGEPLRFLLKYGNIEFEDIRYDLDTWAQHIHITPFGLLPMFEENARKIHQSAAIGRYLAKRVKLVGNDVWENLEIDAMVDTVADLRLRIVEMRFETNEERKAGLLEYLLKEYIPFYLEILEAIAKKNGGYLAVGRLTWADFWFIGILDTFNTYVGNDIIADYPNLQLLKEHVYNIPAIKAWIEERPVTDF